MKKSFYLILKTLFILKIFIFFLSSIFCHDEKRLALKDKFDFKNYDVTTRLTSNYKTQLEQYLKK